VLLLLLELDTLQVTAVLVAPVTVAVNCCVAPKPTVWLVGEMVTLTFEEEEELDELLLLLLPLPQPVAASTRRITAASSTHLAYFISSP